MLAAALYSLASTAILLVGLTGTSEIFLTERAKFFTLDFTDWIPRVSLGLPGLELGR